jgi:hypothetical protein
MDHLDAQAVLAQRAETLESLERRLIGISLKMGTGIFTQWEPKYARTFDLSSFSEDMKAIAQVQSMQLPIEAEKMVMSAAINRVGKYLGVTDEEIKEALAAVDKFDPMKQISDIGGGSQFTKDEPEDDEDDDDEDQK